jgi:hypothetical protein
LKNKGTESIGTGIDPRLPAVGRRLSLQTLFPFFQILLFYYLIFFGSSGLGPAFGRMGVQHPHFLKLVPILGSVKCSISHGD